MSKSSHFDMPNGRFFQKFKDAYISIFDLLFQILSVLVRFSLRACGLLQKLCTAWIEISPRYKRKTKWEDLVPDSGRI